MTALTTDDLSPLQQTYLGVLAVGLVPADLAGDPRFRIEVICAECHALRQGLPRDSFLAREHESTPAFRAELRGAIIDLDRKGVIGIGPPQDLVVMRPERPELTEAPPEAAYGQIDLNRHPPIFDKYLSQRCMDELMKQAAAYRLLMDLYGESGEVWHRLYQQGYADHR